MGTPILFGIRTHRCDWRSTAPITVLLVIVCGLAGIACSSPSSDRCRSPHEASEDTGCRVAIHDVSLPAERVRENERIPGDRNVGLLGQVTWLATPGPHPLTAAAQLACLPPPMTLTTASLVQSQVRLQR